MHPLVALRRHHRETVADLVTKWLRIRRAMRDFDARHRDALRQRLASPIVVLAAVTIVGGLAAIGNGPRKVELHAAAAAALGPRSNGVAGPGSPPPTTAPTTTTTAPPPPQTTPPPPPPAPVLPTGKGMWIWMPDRVEGGDPNAIVARATAAGLSHLYVRTGSSVDGFYAGAFLDALLPVAHAAGIHVFGWDFPYFGDVNADVQRALAAIGYTTPDGQRLDGFSPDIETGSEGVSINAQNAAAYMDTLRNAVGADYPIIATVPRPSALMQAIYPYQEVIGPASAVAPMVYWLNRQPDTDVAAALDYLVQFGKPVMPVGQAYDGSLEGGRPGPPTADEIARFMAAAAAHGAAGVSFWSWQHADPSVWDAIAAAPEFTRTALAAIMAQVGS